MRVKNYMSSFRVKLQQLKASITGKCDDGKGSFFFPDEKDGNPGDEMGKFPWEGQDVYVRTWHKWPLSTVSQAGNKIPFGVRYFKKYNLQRKGLWTKVYVPCGKYLFMEMAEDKLAGKRVEIVNDFGEAEEIQW